VIKFDKPVNLSQTFVAGSALVKASRKGVRAIINKAAARSVDEEMTVLTVAEVKPNQSTCYEPCPK